MKRLTKRAFVGIIATAGIGGSVLLFALSGPAGASIHPAAPNLSRPTKMELLGNSGKPILGKDGKPIMVTVGGPPPTLPQPGSSSFNQALAGQKPLTAEQISQAATSGPAVVQIPSMSDQEKARMLAPDQAK